MRRLFRAISGLLVLVVIALVSALVTMRLAIHKAEVRVPALVGLSVPEAVIQLHRDGLEAGLDGHFYSVTQPAGRVLIQSPAPGTQVRKSWRVRLAVSLGPQKTATPRLEGMDQSLAAVMVQRSGLRIGSLVTIAYPYVPDNTVVAQSPEPGTRDAESPEIDLLIAQSQPSRAQDQQAQARVMPDLVGENFTVAALAIVHSGFTLAPIETPTPSVPASGGPPAHPSGMVVAQDPVPGSQILAGATIRLTVQP